MEQHATTTTHAGYGAVAVARASFGAATFAGTGAMWHVGSIIPCNAVISDDKLRSRWPEEGASH